MLTGKQGPDTPVNRELSDDAHALRTHMDQAMQGEVEAAYAEPDAFMRGLLRASARLHP